MKSNLINKVLTGLAVVVLGNSVVNAGLLSYHMHKETDYQDQTISVLKKLYRLDGTPIIKGQDLPTDSVKTWQRQADSLFILSDKATGQLIEDTQRLLFYGYFVD